MTKRMQRGSLVLVVAAGLAGCHGTSSLLPTAPSTGPFSPIPPVVACAVADVTLSGVVSEATPTGPAPIEGARVFVSDDQDESTDAMGFFRVAPVTVCIPGQLVIWVGKDGYAEVTEHPAGPGFGGVDGWRVVAIDGDTHLEITLVRR
jgi:hypothetical protein